MHFEDRNIRTKASKAFATEPTEVTEVSGPKDKGHLLTRGEADLSFEPCGAILIRSIYISVLSVSSVAKKFPGMNHAL
jgi:hypothetical protein